MCGQGGRCLRNFSREDLMLLGLVAAQSEVRESESRSNSDHIDALVTKNGYCVRFCLPECESHRDRTVNGSEGVGQASDHKKDPFYETTAV